MIVAHNLSTMNSHRNLTQTYGRLSKKLEHLSSGLRINRAADDATGLAVSEKLRAQISSLRDSIMNAQNGITMIQAAEGALDRTHANLRRMRDLGELAANGDKTDGDREHYQAEIDNLVTEIDRIAETAKYNTKKFLNGVIGTTVLEKSETNSEDQFDKLVVDAAGSLSLQVEPNEGWDHRINFVMAGMGSSALGIGSSLSVTTQTAACGLMDAKTIDESINIVSLQRGKLGAFQNRLKHTIKNLTVTRENMQASKSRVRDADRAEEMMEFGEFQIILQADTVRLAHDNQIPQTAFQMLG